METPKTTQEDRDLAPATGDAIGFGICADLEKSVLKIYDVKPRRQSHFEPFRAVGSIGLVWVFLVAEMSLCSAILSVAAARQSPRDAWPYRLVHVLSHVAHFVHSHEADEWSRLPSFVPCTVLAGLTGASLAAPWANAALLIASLVCATWSPPTRPAMASRAACIVGMVTFVHMTLALKMLTIPSWWIGMVIFLMPLRVAWPVEPFRVKVAFRVALAAFCIAPALLGGA
jgi:hypothetical protein